MATNLQDKTRRRATRRAARGGLPWFGELQLDAYLQARDALRRAQAAAGTRRAPPPGPHSAAS